MRDHATLRSKIGAEILFLPKLFKGTLHQKMVHLHQKMNVTLRSKIGTEILFLAKNFQAGRVPDFGTNVPKNERSVTRSKIGTQILILAKTFQAAVCQTLAQMCQKMNVMLPRGYRELSGNRFQIHYYQTRHRSTLPFS